MSKRLVFRSLFVALAGAIFFSLFAGVYLGYKFYKSIFRLSQDQVANFLVNKKSECQKITSCILIPGDILIRRYITPTTWSFDKFAHPYFTHSAFYLGNSLLEEAVGTTKGHQNEIQITPLPKSDWLDSGVESFVIIRPKNIAGKFNSIKINLENISRDPNYKFGLPKPGYKQTTCADLIFQQLTEEGLLNVSAQPKIITPDYLFWVTANDSADFDIIGYNIK